MERKGLPWQIATIFIGSIVGAGLSSGRELNQFFGVYGYKSVIGLILCAVSYIWIGKMIVEISARYGAKSYNEFIALVCPKWIGMFTNVVLTLFLVSSTSIIFAGSSAVVNQYFGVPKWIGFLAMLICSIIFLLKSTQGLFEVNSFVVPFLLVTMTCIFFSAVKAQPELLNVNRLRQLPHKEHGLLASTIVYSGFNIISIIGIVVPLTHELKDQQAIIKGIKIGTVGLTLMSLFITFLMIVNPTYPVRFEIPILAVAEQVGKVFQVALLMVIWLEMFSSQISNIYSLTRSLESQFGISYVKGIILVILVAIPFSMVGFSNLVEVLYPLYGVLSLAFIGSVVIFSMKEKIAFISKKK